MGAVIPVALRWIDDGYKPSLAVVADTALRLGMGLTQKRAQKRAR